MSFTTPTRKTRPHAAAQIQTQLCLTALLIIATTKRQITWSSSIRFDVGVKVLLQKEIDTVDLLNNTALSN